MFCDLLRVDLFNNYMTRAAERELGKGQRGVNCAMRT